MASIAMGELIIIGAICSFLGAMLVGAAAAVVLVVRGSRSARKLARCPSCTTSIDAKSRACPSCERDLPSGWA